MTRKMCFIRVELLKYVYFCGQTSILKARNNKFQDLINAPRIDTFLIARFLRKSFLKHKTNKYDIFNEFRSYSKLCDKIYVFTR